MRVCVCARMRTYIIIYIKVRYVRTGLERLRFFDVPTTLKRMGYGRTVGTEQFDVSCRPGREEIKINGDVFASRVLAFAGCWGYISPQNACST